MTSCRVRTRIGYVPSVTPFPSFSNSRVNSAAPSGRHRKGPDGVTPVADFGGLNPSVPEKAHIRLMIGFESRCIGENAERACQSSSIDTVVFGRRPGQRVKAGRFAPKVLKLVGEGQSYREVSHRLGLSKNTILDIVRRDRAA
jgi:hypothetical protein